MDNQNKMVLSNEAKKTYLKKLSKRIIKILCLIEEENETKNDPTAFIIGQLFEINSANSLFDFQLTDVIVKLNGVLNYKQESYEVIRKQIFEIKGIVDYLFKNII